jgi:CNT family concentrative nucleoside transporter
LGRFTGILGILAVLAAAWLGSTNRRRIRWRTVAWGLGLQITFAFLVLRFDYGQRAMAWAGGVVNNMLSATFAGTQVLFGELGLPNAGAFGKVIAPARARSLRSRCCPPSSSSPHSSRFSTTSA